MRDRWTEVGADSRGTDSVGAGSKGADSRATQARVGRAAASLAALLACGFSVLTTPAEGTVPDYTTYQLEARSNFGDGFNLPSGSSFNSGTPAIAPDGTVTVRLLVVGNTGNGGLFYGRDGVGGVVYDAPTDRFVGDPGINSAGEVSFERTWDFESEGVYVYDPVTGNSTLRVPVGGSLGIQNFGDPQINASGQVGCRVDLGSAQAFVVDDAGTQTVYAREGVDGVGYLFLGEFNDAGQLAGKVRLGGIDESRPDEIRRYEPGGGFTTIAVDQNSDPGSIFTRFGNGVSLSNSGWVAFVGRTSVGDGIYVSDGVTLRTIATVADPDINSIDFFYPSVNDDGLCAFRAFDGAGLRVIFAGDGTTLKRVVTEHDILPTDLGDARVDQNDSSPVFGGNPAINDRGDVAFAATLTPPDNNQIEWGTGLFVARGLDPAAVDPSPAATFESRWTAQPNPFGGRVRVDLRLEPSQVGRGGNGGAENSGAENGGADGAQLANGTAPSVAIHDAQGRLVRTLSGRWDGDVSQVFEWDGRDERGGDVPAGVFFFRASDESVTPLRVVLVR
ncbi:MAG: hypothetical protein R3E97_06820 [Candidatus Eisenbacteria bacterium]